MAAVARLVVAREEALCGYRGNRPFREYKATAMHDVEACWDRFCEGKKRGKLREFGTLVNNKLKTWGPADPLTWTWPG